MIKILQFLWEGCWHKWQEPSGRITDHYFWSVEEEIHPYKRTQISRCSKCGKTKKVEI